MECPRCESDLTVYTLSGHEAVVCQSCGYVGLPADHLPEREPDETWEEALQRFYRDAGGSEGETESRESDGGHRRRRERRKQKRQERERRRR